MILVQILSNCDIYSESIKRSNAAGANMRSEHASLATLALETNSKNPYGQYLNFLSS